ncbi:MAG: RNA-dependent DNA polymerase [Candidatus Niyogibacteria bacterium]|nr:RNA-dependent DNA polymerase [Candidatus Niyogibacteria bacterium]
MIMFEQIRNFTNLHSAYLKARSGKRYRGKILEFSYDLEGNLLKLKNDLESGNYQHGEYREFVVCDSKKRHIKAAPFRDRIVHHALCNIIEPIFDKGFIYDSYACREGKGTHKAVKKLQSFIRSASELSAAALKEDEEVVPKIYCLKCDVSKYFDSIDQNVLLKLIEKKIQDAKVFNLIKMIIRSNNAEAGKGIPIGNLTSQLFANIYLNELDRFVKRNLQIRYYLRYMDDFLILDFSKKKLRWTKDEIQKFLENKLCLKLHPKKATISPIDKGIDFLGYIVFENHKLLRKSTVKRFVKRIRKYMQMVEQNKMSEEKLNASVMSWVAYAKYARSWKLRKYIGERLGLPLTE